MYTHIYVNNTQSGPDGIFYCYSEDSDATAVLRKMVERYNDSETTNEHEDDFDHAFTLRGEMNPIEDMGITFVDLQSV